MIIYTPYGNETNTNRIDGEKQIDIFKNKMRILEIAKQVNDKYFIMKDLDIIYSWGIEEMQKYLDDNDDYGAVALWPNKGGVINSDHVSTSFMMIRTCAVELFERITGCFCWHLCRNLRNRNWKVDYINGNIIHPGG